MRTAFASDFDGTLHFGVRGISAEDLEAIARYREAGGLFGINTGRSARSLLNQTEGVIDPDFIIAVSGAVILGRGGERIRERLLPREIALDVLKRYRWPALGLCIAVSDESWAVPPLAWAPGLPYRIAQHRAMLLSRVPEKVYGLSMRFFREGFAARIAQDILKRYRGEVNVFQNLMSLDIVSGDCSKGAGLLAVKETFGVDAIGAMGDSYNDLPQLEAADVAYTFPDAAPQVRAAADVLVPGVAAALKDLSARPQG